MKYAALLAFAGCADPYTPVGIEVDGYDHEDYMMTLDDERLPDCEGANGYVLAGLVEGQSENHVLIVPIDNDRWAISAWLLSGVAEDGCFYDVLEDGEVYWTIDSDQGVLRVPYPFVTRKVYWR